MRGRFSQPETSPPRARRGERRRLSERLRDSLTATHRRVNEPCVEERFAQRPWVVHLRRRAPLGRREAKIYLLSQVHLPSRSHGRACHVACHPSRFGRVHVLERAVLGLENKFHADSIRWRRSKLTGATTTRELTLPGRQETRWRAFWSECMYSELVLGGVTDS